MTYKYAKEDGFEYVRLDDDTSPLPKIWRSDGKVYERWFCYTGNLVYLRSWRSINEKTARRLVTTWAMQ